MFFNSVGLRRNLKVNETLTFEKSKFSNYVLVTVAFSLHLPQDIDPIIVPQRPRHLVVVHRQVVLLDAPQFREPGRVDDLKNARLPVLPRDIIRVPLRRVVQELLQEIPQKTPVCKENISSNKRRYSQVTVTHSCWARVSRRTLSERVGKRRRSTKSPSSPSGSSAAVPAPFVERPTSEWRSGCSAATSYDCSD